MKKITDEQKKFLREFFSSQKNLSKSEVEVVILVLQGLINREVANRLCVAEKTIKFHLGNAYKKLKISKRSELIWTLPLADFVGKADPPSPTTPGHSTPNAENSSIDHSYKRREGEMLASGISKVTDGLNEPPQQPPAAEPSF